MRSAPYAKIISLGQACDAANQIRRIFDQTEAYPFDWLVTPYDGLVAMIERRFADFLDEGNLEVERRGVLDTRYKVRLLHDFKDKHAFRQTLPEVKAKYLRRIERFDAILGAGGPILFVRSQQYDDADVVDEGRARRLLALLRRTFPDTPIDLLVQNPTAAGIPEVIEGGLWLLRLDPPDPFNWKGDPVGWETLFRRVLESASGPDGRHPSADAPRAATPR